MPSRTLAQDRQAGSTGRSFPGEPTGPASSSGVARACSRRSTPPRTLAWKTVGLWGGKVDSTEWRIDLEPAGTGTRIVQSYDVLHVAPPGLDRVYWLLVKLTGIVVTHWPTICNGWPGSPRTTRTGRQRNLLAHHDREGSWNIAERGSSGFSVAIAEKAQGVEHARTPPRGSSSEMRPSRAPIPARESTCRPRRRGHSGTPRVRGRRTRSGRTGDALRCSHTKVRFIPAFRTMQISPRRCPRENSTAPVSVGPADTTSRGIQPARTPRPPPTIRRRSARSLHDRCRAATAPGSAARTRTSSASRPARTPDPPGGGRRRVLRP